MPELKDPADVVAFLEPLGQEERLRVLRLWFFGDGAPPVERSPEELAYLRRVDVAMQLARDYETCCALLRREEVHPSRLDHDALSRLRKRGLDV